MFEPKRKNRGFLIVAKEPDKEPEPKGESMDEAADDAEGEGEDLDALAKDAGVTDLEPFMKFLKAAITACKSGDY